MNAPVSIFQFKPEVSDVFSELDEVRLLVAARTKYGETVPPGSEGTVLSVWADGAAYVVEFEAGLATVEAEHLTAAE